LVLATDISKHGQHFLQALLLMLLLISVYRLAGLQFDTLSCCIVTDISSDTTYSVLSTAFCTPHQQKCVWSRLLIASDQFVTQLTELS